MLIWPKDLPGLRAFFGLQTISVLLIRCLEWSRESNHEGYDEVLNGKSFQRSDFSTLAHTSTVLFGSIIVTIV